MLPGIMNHLGTDGLNQLKRIASLAKQGLPTEDTDIPELVESFENTMNTADGAVESKTTEGDNEPREVVD